MSENKVIIPTIGRRVWFWSAGLRRTDVTCHDPKVPMDAGIVYVWNDRMVNLDVTDHAGKHHAFTSVELWQGDCDRPSGSYCEWMPFQKGQAPKQDDIKAMVATALADLLKPGAIEVVRKPPQGRAEWANHMDVLDRAATAEALDKTRTRSHVCGVTCHPNGENCNNYCGANRENGMPDAPRTYEQALLTFGKALELLTQGAKVARVGWNGKGLWLELQRPDAHSKMTLPYIFMSYPDDAANTPGARVPWLASQTDMLSEDWVLA
jgi:hypothetical protein